MRNDGNAASPCLVDRTQAGLYLFYTHHDTRYFLRGLPGLFICAIF